MTPLTPGTPDRGVLYTIHEQGKDADLSFLKDKDADIVAERKYIEAVKREGAAKRKELADQIKAWNQLQDNDPTKQRERDKTRTLLVELQDEMETTISEEALLFAQDRKNEVVKTYGKATTKVSEDFKGMFAPNDVIPWQDKAVTGLKYAAGAMGLVWLWKKISGAWKKMVPGTSRASWFGRWFGILGTGAAGVVGASYVLAGTTDRTTGPTLAVGPGRKPNETRVAPPADVLPIEDRKYANMNLLSLTEPFVIDGTKVQFVHPNISTTHIGIDGRAFSASSKDWGGLDIGMALKLGEAKKNGEYIDISAPFMKARVSRIELGKIVEALRTSKGTSIDIPVQIEQPQSGGTYAPKTITMTFKLEGTV